jgi:hypothetical protein
VTRAQNSRRASDGGQLSAALARVITWSRRYWQPVLGGRILLAVAVGVIAVTAPSIDAGASARVLAAVVAAIVVLIFASFAVPWPSIPRSLTLAFPLVIFAALAGLGLAGHGLGANFTGLITLCFAYVGLTQSSYTCVKMVPVGVATYLAANDNWSTPAAGRLTIALASWLLIGIVFAELIAHQTMLTAKLRAAAHIDALTGVANRRDLEHRLARGTPWSSATWTISSGSTPLAATPPATGSWPNSAWSCRPRCARATTPPATAARSSRWCCRAPATSRPPTRCAGSASGGRCSNPT